MFKRGLNLRRSTFKSFAFRWRRFRRRMSHVEAFSAITIYRELREFAEVKELVS